ncbi:MAG: DUF6152 family protein [Candidatus Rariloculaceae bacterium]
MKQISALLTLFVAFAASPVSAHHSASIFDRDTVLVFPGTVTRFNWANPHVYIYVATRDDAGRIIEWEIETDATPILLRSGWTSESLQPGSQVVVRANPDRNVNRNHALLVSIEREDGAVFAARSDFLRTEDESDLLASAASMNGIWELSYRDYNSFYAVWAEVALTEKALAAQATYDARVEAPAAQCIAHPTPTILVAPYANEIVIQDDVVLIRNERFNIERTVYMDGRGHPENGEPSNQGHSIGWWEDDVLVFDTTLFANNRSPIFGRPIRPGGVPSGPGKHVVERLALSDDGTRIVIDFTQEDPEYLAEPFSSTVEWYFAPHLEMRGFGCDSENATRFTLE